MVHRRLTSEETEAARIAKSAAVQRHGNLRPGDNVDLLVSKLTEAASKGRPPVYVECGVFTGSAFMAVKEHLDAVASDYRMFGVDSFEGFPTGVVDHHDHPENFLTQHRAGQISDACLEMAKARTSDFTDVSHLTCEYFRRDDLISMHMERLSGQDRARVVVGAFSASLDSLACDEIDVLFLDCDLYESYKICLEKLFDRIVPGGVVVFDEVYSYKYPGARDAVMEFFSDKMHLGRFEVFTHPEPFERWCFVRNE